MNHPKSDFDIDIIRVCVKYGLCSEYVLRDELIKKDFFSLKSSGIKMDESFRTLSEKYYLSEKAISAIVYNKKKKGEDSSRISG